MTTIKGAFQDRQITREEAQRIVALAKNHQGHNLTAKLTGLLEREGFTHAAQIAQKLTSQWQGPDKPFRSLNFTPAELVFQDSPKESKGKPQVTLPKLNAAQAARNDEIAKNNAIYNHTYMRLGESWRARLKGAPIPNWFTFGMHASYEAGKQMEGLRYVVASLDVRNQDRVSDGIKSANYALTNNKVFQGMQLLLTKGIQASTYANLLGAMEEGNRRIFWSIAPCGEAYETAGGGQKGLEAVKKLIVQDPCRDPKHYLIQAFTAYAKAEELFKQGDIKGCVAATVKGNELIGQHEQEVVLQPIFNRRSLADEFSVISQHLTFNGKQLLPNKCQNWAVLGHRMKAIIGLFHANKQSQAMFKCPWKA